jgi:hypothetical protein
MRQKIFYFGLVIMLVALTTSACVQRVGVSSQVPQEQIAIVKVKGDIAIVSVDGKRLRKYVDKGVRLELTPGKHTLEIKSWHYEKGAILYPVYSIDSVYPTLFAEPGHRYLIRGKKGFFATKITVSIEDVTSER